MTAEETRRLPPSVGGLLDLAAAAYFERFPLYAGLGLAVLVACALPEFLWRAGGVELVVKSNVVQLVDIFADALVVATVAIGIATRVAVDGPRPGSKIVGLALDRWLPVVGALLVVDLFVELTLPAGAIGPVDDPLVTALTAPLLWLTWGMLSLAAPIAALSGERPGMAMFIGFSRAVMLALRVGNLGRLCLVAFASVAPLLVQNVLGDVLQHRGAAHVDFWANYPIDALTIGPLAALQTVFALDFARRESSR